MYCGKVLNLISAYIDGELTGTDQLAIREHLRGCPRCAAEFETLTNTKKLISTMAVRVVSPDFESRINDAVRIHAASSTPSRWAILLAPIPENRMRRFHVMAAATGLLLAVAIWNPLRAPKQGASMVRINSVPNSQERVERAPLSQAIFVHDPSGAGPGAIPVSSGAR